MIRSRDITGVILCGGEGSRLGGLDKPLELISGKPMVAHVRTRLAPQVGRVLISCNRNEQRYAQWGDTVVRDDVAGLGPLAGILAALQCVDTAFVFVCPGDAPLLSKSLVARLVRAASGSNADLWIPHDGERRQHLFPLFPSALRTHLEAFIRAGGRSGYAWIDTLNSAVVDASDERHSFTNVNSWTDFALASESISREGISREGPPREEKSEAAHSR